MKYVSALLFFAAVALGAAVAGREYLFPASVVSAGVEKPRPEASFLKLDEGVLADMAALPAYAATAAATGAAIGKPALFGEPSKSDYHF